MSCSLSTHVLDTAAGRPAAGVAVELYRGRRASWRAAETDADGRAASPTTSQPGTYRLVFHPPSPFFTRVELRSSSRTATTTSRSSSRPYGCASYRGS